MRRKAKNHSIILSFYASKLSIFQSCRHSSVCSEALAEEYSSPTMAKEEAKKHPPLGSKTRGGFLITIINEMGRDGQKLFPNDRSFLVSSCASAIMK